MGKNGLKVIVFNGKKWLNETNIKYQLIHSNLEASKLQYSSELRKQRQELLVEIFRRKFCNSNNNGL